MRSKFKWIFTLLVALSMQFSFAQDKTVTGVVSDESGPLPGANVVVKGTTRGAQTDLDGKYSIKVKQGEALVFSFISMQDQTKVVGDANTINVKMASSSKVLEEVVVNMGYFKRDINKTAAAVSVVSAEEIARQSPNISVANALQGKAAGVQVTALNGKPGQSAYVSVRGNVSISGTSASAIYVVDGAVVAGSEIASISNSDIENVTILKDGASAALYGARGGNGVIVITTKRGKGEKAKFQYTTSYGYSEKTKDPFDMMNTDQKIAYENALGGGPSVGSTPAQLALLRSYDHNWQDDLLQKGELQNHDFSYSASDGKFSNRLSLGYAENKGIIKNLKGYYRIAGRYNSDYQAADWIKFGFNIGGSYEVYGQPRDRNNAQNPFRAMYDYNPYEPFYERDPVTGAINYNPDGSPIYNTPVAGFPVHEAIVNNPEQERFFRIYGRPYAEIKLYKGLVYTNKINLNYERRQREAFTKPFSALDLIVGDPAARGQKNDQGWDSFEYQWTNQLAYNFKLGESHSIGLLAMYEYYKNNFRSYTLTRKGFVNGDLDTAGTVVVGVPSTRRDENAIISYYGGVEYDYKDKYLLTASYRRDGASVLGANNKWEDAIGGSIGWVASKDLFPNSKYVNNLKLRASYGELNSTNGTSAYNAQSTFGTSPYAGATSTIYSGGNVGNVDLKFEQVKKFDFGFESSLLNRRVTLSSSYFIDKRADFLYNDSTSNGPNWNTLINAGDWTAKGIELEIRAVVLKNDNYNLALYANAAKFDRKINKLSRPDNPNDQLLRGVTINKVGYQPDEFYLPEYVGVDPANGHALYRKLDGSITDVFSADDSILTGKTPYAKYEGGFGLEFSAYGFDVAADFNFKQGNYVYNYMWLNMNNDGIDLDSNQAVEAFDYWTLDNPNASNPAPFPLSGIDSNEVSTRFLQDGSYVRFRSLNFGYTFGKKTLGKLPLSQVRLFTQIQNLYTWTKYKGDPEVGVGSGETQTTGAIPGQYALYSYPTVKSFIFGLTINF
jgi:TonB-linked SusC/RagA family outer membrane protein